MRKTLILKAAGLFVLFVLTLAVAGGCWIKRTEDNCWKFEAVEAFQKYGSLKTRSEVLRSVADIEQASGSNPVEVIEKEPNGCSFGSNGRTILRFFFDNKNKLTRIQVFRDYMAADYEMDLIEEKNF